MTDTCPVCGETYNHVVANGYRNQYPTDVAVSICTDETERIWVHVIDEADVYKYPDAI